MVIWCMLTKSPGMIDVGIDGNRCGVVAGVKIVKET